MVEVSEHLEVPRFVRVARRAARPRLNFASVPSAEAGRIVPEWGALAERCVGDNCFFHTDFALPAMRYLGADVAIATVSDPAGNMVALAPFIRTRLGRIAPAARLWAHDFAPLGLPLIDRDAVEAAAGTLLDGLAPPLSGVSLIAADLPLEGPVARALVSAALRKERPVDVLDGHVRAAIDRSIPGADDPRALLPVRRRKEFARQMRRLAEVGEVTINAAVEPGEVRDRFEAFILLEAAGWKGKRGSALISTAATRDFARAAVASRADAGAARIDSIDLGGEPIAMVVSFAAGGTAWTWKIAYDETYARFSPGVQLMLETTKAIFSDPTLERIDSCASANHPMVDHLWPGRLAIGSLVIGPPGGSAVHRVGLAAARAEIVARAAVRRLRS
jgi:CelD/BcsL family acetyltransferase involved in cellulose biosynthesis